MVVLLCLAACEAVPDQPGAESDRTGAEADRAAVEDLIRRHALAWETGDTAVLAAIIHPEARLAYPRRRVDRATWIRELRDFSESHRDTRIYIHRITVENDDFAVEWQFATTDAETGDRTAVGDAIIGQVADGRIVLWKEYLDGRVPALQREGVLELEEGEEPFPWPLAR